MRQRSDWPASLLVSNVQLLLESEHMTAFYGVQHSPQLEVIRSPFPLPEIPHQCGSICGVSNLVG
jgi:hypothetical protein